MLTFGVFHGGERAGSGSGPDKAGAALIRRARAWRERIAVAVARAAASDRPPSS